jgi:ribosomal protein S18 acetylase RimI-like enzyme
VTIRPLAEADRAAAGALLAAAFPDKLAAMLGDRAALRLAVGGGRPEIPCGPGLFADLLPPAGERVAWVAVAGGAPGRLCGYVQVREASDGAGGREAWRRLRRHLGVWRASRAWLFVVVFHSARIPQGELLVDTLAVHPQAQGSGIGRRLVDFALEEARRRGKTAAILYCIDRNERARGVYARAGFHVVRREQLWWLRWLLGFSSSYLMRARVVASPETAG